MTRKKTNEEFVKELHDINPFVVPLTLYEGAQNTMKFRCSICGSEYETKPCKELLRVGKGCRKCSYLSAGKVRRKDSLTFESELKNKNPNITLLTAYVQKKQKVRCRCNLCGNVWEAAPDSLLQGVGCPACFHSSTSFIERFIYLSMCEVLGDAEVISRDRASIKKELDIYIPSLKLAIEYGSWYWHKSRIKKDNEKRETCRIRGIRLISIYDSCNSNEIKEDPNILIFKQDLSQEKDYHTSKQFIISICEDYGIDYSVLNGRWKDIVNNAYQQSRRLTTSEFVKLVRERNSHNIEILGEYKSSYTPILCQCKDCGYEWKPRPNNLINENAGCPRCSGTIHYTDKEFTSKLASINPDIELLEPYRYSKQSILCRCKKCGFEWNASAGKLLKKRLGCPRCIGKIRYSNEDFILKLNNINPDIMPLEPYPCNNKTKMRCLCKVCGNRFSMRPNSLLSGQGCPKCSNKKRIQESRKSNDDFVMELEKINPNVIPLEPYLFSKSKINCRCKKCANEWRATPNSLLHGYGCPKCAKKTTSEKNKKRVLCIETNVIYESLKDASARSGLSGSLISMCCTGKRESSGGYHWKYLK